MPVVGPMGGMVESGLAVMGDSLREGAGVWLEV